MFSKVVRWADGLIDDWRYGWMDKLPEVAPGCSQRDYEARLRELQAESHPPTDPFLCKFHRFIRRGRFPDALPGSPSLVEFLRGHGVNVIGIGNGHLRFLPNDASASKLLRTRYACE